MCLAKLAKLAKLANFRIVFLVFVRRLTIVRFTGIYNPHVI